MFREFDTSGDGFVDLAELQVALAKAGTPVSRQEAQEILTRVDENGDGQIDLSEFGKLADMLGLLIDEVRVEVSRTSSLNGPILMTAFTAGFLGIFWKYILAVSALYQQTGAASVWLPESLTLLQTVPAGFLADYSQAVELAPLLTMSCTSGFAYAVGDLVAQRVEGRGQGRWRVELLDLARCARNALLGFALHGPLVYGWIQVLEGPLAQLVGSASGVGSEQQGGVGTLLLKILLDQTLFSALINLLYATCSGLLSSLTPSEAFARARQLLVPAMVSSWRFWPVVQLVSYSPLIPVDLKLLWIDTMEILWVAYLSLTVNSAPGAREAIPWGEGRLVDCSAGLAAVLDEPGDSDLLYVGPLALFGSATALVALSWPGLVVQLMTG